MNKHVKTIWAEIKKLPKNKLYVLLQDYDDYVIEITDRQDGSVPACVAEFYENDYPELKGA